MRLRPRALAALPPAGSARTLTWCSLIDAAGTGAFLSGSVIFFTRVKHLSPAEVGLGLSAAGFASMAATFPIGVLSDRLGARRLLILLNALLGVLFLGYLAVTGAVGFFVVVIAAGIVQTATFPVRSALTFALLGSAERVRVQAYMRVMFNVGISVGTVGAGIALAIDSAPAYDVLVTADAASFLFCALLLRSLPEPAPGPAKPADSRSPWAAVTDRAFLCVTALSAWSRLTQPILALGIPLWVLHHGHSPHWLVAVLFAENTVLVILLQVRASKRADNPEHAGRVLGLAFAFIVATCLLAAASSARSEWVNVLLLATSGFALTLAEILAAAATWGLVFTLARPGQQGAYQGLFSAGTSAQEACFPAIIAFLLTELGGTGWLLLGLSTAAVGLTAPRVVAWAVQSRAEVPVPG